MKRLVNERTSKTAYCRVKGREEAKWDIATAAAAKLKRRGARLLRRYLRTEREAERVHLEGWPHSIFLLARRRRAKLPERKDRPGGAARA